MSKESREFDKEAKALVQLLALEVASELELHYEPNEYYALGATIESLKRAISFLEQNNVKVPDVVTNVINRYHSQMN